MKTSGGPAASDNGAGKATTGGNGGGGEGNGNGCGTTAEGGDDGSNSTTGGGTAASEPPNKQQPSNSTAKPSTPAAASQKPPLPSTTTQNQNKAGGGATEQETGDKKPPIGSDSGDPDDPEEDEILEESPCKRWSKRREKVKQRDVPGIDCAYLAMDNETGNEVVWNEVLFSERKNFREQEEKIRAVFDNLTHLEHPNLVKFHEYWMDTASEKPRIIFITEYMSSGSMSRFLQRARSSGTLLNIKAWKSWTRQILIALSYLHSCDPPIVHANLTCNTIFIQQNGLVKIGCVAPNTIHHHVKTYRENIKNIHYLAPEYDHLTEATTQADIYSFGVCALEMATTGALQSGNLNGVGGSAPNVSTLEKAASAPPEGAASTGSSTPAPGCGGASSTFHMVTEDLLRKALDSVEDQEQKEVIERCLEHDPAKRANVAEVLDRLGPADEPEKNDASLDEDGFIEERQQHSQHESTPIPAADRATSPQEAAPNIEGGGGGQANQAAIAVAASSNLTHSQSQPQQQDGYQQQQQPHSQQCTVTTTIATHASATATTTTTAPSSTVQPSTTTTTTLLQAPASSIATSTQAAQQQQTAPDEGYHTTQSIVDAPTGTNTPLSAELSLTNAAISQHRETRQVVQMQADVLDGQQLRVQLQLDDQMNRQLTGPLRDEDTPESLVAEFIQFGFVSESNSPKMRELLTNVLTEHRKRELEMAARREFGESGQQQQSCFTSTASSANSSAHQSPKHQNNQSLPQAPASAASRPS